MIICALIFLLRRVQDAEKIAKIVEKIKSNDSFIFAEQIHVYIFKGKTYILDGHNRIKAAIQNNQRINTIKWLTGLWNVHEQNSRNT